jgi:hypothetical protein
MQTRRERGHGTAHALALGVVAACALFAATPVSALEYVTKHATVGAGESTRIVKRCPGTATAVGGGIKGPRYMEQRVSSVGPFDDDDPDPTAEDGWAARVDGYVLSDLKLTLLVVCDQASHDILHILDVPVPAQNGLGATSGDCLPGTHVAGGGGWTTPGWGQMRLTRSYPFDSAADIDQVPDDAWYAAAHNATGQERHLSTTAWCRAGSYQYVQKQRTVKAGDQGQARVPCPAATRLTSGGFNSTGNPAHVALSSMFPSDGSDPDRRPDDVWVARIEDFGGADRTLTAHAVCKG